MLTEERVRIRVVNDILGDSDWGLFSLQDIEDIKKIKNYCAQALARKTFATHQNQSNGMWRADYVAD
jgi:hypothetical protein